MSYRALLDGRARPFIARGLTPLASTLERLGLDSQAEMAGLEEKGESPQA